MEDRFNSQPDKKQGYRDQDVMDHDDGKRYNQIFIRPYQSRQKRQKNQGDKGKAGGYQNIWNINNGWMTQKARVGFEYQRENSIDPQRN